MKKPAALWKVAQALVRILTSLLFELKVYGRHYIPATGGVLLVSNHESYLDPALIGAQLSRPISYLAKSELFENRFFSWLIRKLHAYPVRQGAGDMGAMRETIHRLQDGHLLLIFPEGSRTEDGKLGPIEPGAALVVRRARVHVIPVAIDGSFRAWPKGRLLPKPSPIGVLFGPPMDLANMKTGDIVHSIDRTLRELKSQLQTKQSAGASATGANIRGA